MINILRFALVIVVAAVALPAMAFDTPRALIDAIYAPYIAKGAPAPAETYFSDSLTQLLAAKVARAEGEDVGIGFDPFINGQDFLLFDVQVSEPQIIGDRALVTVRFFNFDHPNALAISLIKEASGWKVDDIASMGIEHHWLLSWLLAFDPFEEL